MPETDYLIALEDFRLLCNEALKISNATDSRPITPGREELPTLIFAKQVAHGVAVLKLLPTLEKGKTELRDVSSVFCLARCMLETYYAFHHICIESVSPEELEFRYALWEYHSKVEFLKMVESLNSNDPDIPEQKKVIEILKQKLLSSSFFKTLPKSQKKTLPDGKQGFYLTTEEIARRAGIPENYHKGVYHFLSNYTNTLGFSVRQLKNFQAGDPKSLGLLQTALVYSTIFLVFSIRDFLKLFPEQNEKMDAKTFEIIKKWEETFSEIKEIYAPRA